MKTLVASRPRAVPAKPATASQILSHSRTRRLSRRTESLDVGGGPIPLPSKSCELTFARNRSPLFRNPGARVTRTDVQQIGIDWSMSERRERERERKTFGMNGSR